MVAGATGIDLVLLVVAADEGVMPQTREHLAICELLGSTRGVVALTKVDLVDAEIAELAARGGATARGRRPSPTRRSCPSRRGPAPGLERAARSARRAAAAAPQPRTPRRGPPRLGVDRCFTHARLRHRGDRHAGRRPARGRRRASSSRPAGRRRACAACRVTARPSSSAAPGARSAVNLQGVELAERRARGRCSPTPTRSRRRTSFDVQLCAGSRARRPLGSASRSSCSPAPRERRARVAPIGARRARAGRDGLRARPRRGRAPRAAPRRPLRGARLRAHRAGGTTFGGGVVLDVAPPRRRRSDPALAPSSRCSGSATRRGARVRIAAPASRRRAGEPAPRDRGGAGPRRGARDALRRRRVEPTASGAWLTRTPSPSRGAPLSGARGAHAASRSARACSADPRTAPARQRPRDAADHVLRRGSPPGES